MYVLFIIYASDFRVLQKKSLKCFMPTGNHSSPRITNSLLLCSMALASNLEIVSGGSGMGQSGSVLECDTRNFLENLRILRK